MLRILGLALLMFATTAVAEVRDVQTYFFQPKLGDFKSELQTARQEGKTGVLIMFQMADCPFCERMKSTVLNQSSVQDYYRKHFLVFELDVKGDTPMVDFKGANTTEKDFALKNRARATPTFLFFDTSGDLVTRYIGVTKDADEFLLLGHYVVDGVYKDKPFAVYKLQARQ
ncbi:thioredoxin [Sulfuriferula plumbiphila]|uniref:Thioredoxin n=1 Tax=Sulfuriferula plumbiphila TaxID=171865 RepID=A0A512L429_9PROT|nr:thioredoxin family protein [Sulfuriferula plumbiphila]BBP05479.1 thioredoxin [Sulfuriferula plumbiphila]GEP29224.1 thioredoxin [Sulfuriferula plumbiphila]